jgi:hypothetical protein
VKDSTLAYVIALVTTNIIISLYLIYHFIFMLFSEDTSKLYLLGIFLLLIGFAKLTNNLLIWIIPEKYLIKLENRNKDRIDSIFSDED